MNVTGCKQLGIKDEESHLGVTGKAGVKNDLKKTEEWMWLRWGEAGRTDIPDRGKHVTKDMILVVFIELLLVVGTRVCCMCGAALTPPPPPSRVEME